MDPRSPLTIGTFPSDLVAAQENRAEAARVFSSPLVLASITLTAIASMGLSGLLFWAELVRYNAALAACAGV